MSDIRICWKRFAISAWSRRFGRPGYGRSSTRHTVRRWISTTLPPVGALSGISALQVAAWHFYDVDPEGDAYLRKLIEACHREGIQVYAWLELPSM